MLVVEYLKEKYKVDTPTTLLAVEARIFGIPYPLQTGWLKKYGDTQITESMRNKLTEVLSSRSTLKAADGMRVLGVEPSASALVALERKKLRREARKQAKRLERAAAKLRDAQRLAKNAAPKQKHVPRQPVVTLHVNGIDVMSRDFLSTYEWRVVRMQALKKYGLRCQCCGASPADGAVMNVDHIKPRKLFPQLALDVNNLQVLCHECNHGKGNWDMTDWRDAHHEDRIDPELQEHLRSIMRAE